MWLNGIVLISSILNFQTTDFAVGNDLPYVTFLPSYTTTAWYHKRLPADLPDHVPEALRLKPTVVTVWTAHQSPDPIDGKLSWSATVISIPAPTVIKVDTVAITTAAPRGLAARATMRSSRRSSFVSSSITVEFAAAGAHPAAGPTVLLMFIPSG